MAQLFNIGDEVFLDQDTSVFDTLPDTLRNVTGVIVAATRSTFDCLDDDDEGFEDCGYWEYEVSFPFEFVELFQEVPSSRAWVVEDELVLARRKPKEPTGFSKFIRKIEDDV